MASVGILYVTLLVTVVLCYLVAITSATHLGLPRFQHTGSNLLNCRKTPRHIEKEEGFKRRKGP